MNYFLQPVVLIIMTIMGLSSSVYNLQRKKYGVWMNFTKMMFLLGDLWQVNLRPVNDCFWAIDLIRMESSQNYSQPNMYINKYQICISTDTKYAYQQIADMYISKYQICISINTKYVYQQEINVLSEILIVCH